MKKTLTISIITLIFIILCWFVFRPYGLLWLFRTGGWDSWSKVLKGNVTSTGVIEYPVKINWDFVRLSIVPKSDNNSELITQVTLKIINEPKEWISVRCGQENEDKTGCIEETIIHEITENEEIILFRGSLVDFHNKWIPIEISTADGGNKINVCLVVESELGQFENDAIPFTVEAKWHSVGF